MQIGRITLPGAATDATDCSPYPRHLPNHMWEVTTTTPSALLSRDELFQLTGAVQRPLKKAKAQMAQWLKEQDFVFRPDLQGWPQVSRAHMEERMRSRA